MAANVAPHKPASTSRPNHTLYCSNLPDKLQKDDLKQALYMLFSTYGAVLDIIALKTPKMRGQAHVLFRDVNSSTQAMRALQGQEFFGKEMKLSYATTKSDTLAKLDGTFKQPESSTTGASKAESSSLQQSIFAGPPGAGTSLPPTQPPPSLSAPLANGANDAPSPAAGVKRRRDDESDEDEAPMEMDDEAMEESDDDE